MIKAKTVASLFRYEKRWIQGDYARNIEGLNTNFGGLNARQWCLAGAIYKVYPFTWSEMMEKIEKLIRGSIIHWNDNPRRTFKQVKALVKKAGI